MAKVLQKKVVTSTHPTDLVVGQWYHLHVPAGTTSITRTDGFISFSELNNIRTKLTGIDIYVSHTYGFGFGGGVAFSCCVTPTPPYANYLLDNAASDFDCDFCYSSSTGTITNLLQFITEYKTVVLTKDSKVLVK